MTNKTITTKQLRDDFASVLSSLQAGQEVLVMDGQTLIARLSPVAGASAMSAGLGSLHVGFAKMDLPFP